MEVALTHLRGADPRLGELIDRVGAFALKPRHRASPYQALGRAIIGQQISGAAANAILGRVQASLGGIHFPDPERILEAPIPTLRALGLSGSKTLSLQDLARRTLAGEVPTRRRLLTMTEEEALAHLTPIRGVGPWTVHMLLIFNLGHPDVLPVSDLGVQKGFGRVFLKGRRPSIAQMHRRAERWRPYRSAASWYLWRALELTDWP